MAQKSSEGAEALLQRVLDADRALQAARDALLDQGDDKAILGAIRKEVERSLADKDPLEGGARLIRTSDLLLEIGGPEAARLLLDTLRHEDPGVRLAAGEALTELMYDRFKEVALVIEAEVDKGAAADPTAMSEVPFLLAEVGEPGGVKIMTKLLAHPDGEVVGAAVEGLAALGDASAIKSLESLKDDKRKVLVEDESEGTGEVTVGDLAREAVEHLRRQRNG